MIRATCPDCGARDCPPTPSGAIFCPVCEGRRLRPPPRAPVVLAVRVWFWAAVQEVLEGEWK